MDNKYDLIIIGAGPAGLSAAIYMARAKYRVLVLEKEDIGGQILITNEVVNYPGVYSASGEDLTSVMKQQAMEFGAEFKKEKVIEVELCNNEKSDTNQVKDNKNNDKLNKSSVYKKIITEKNVYETYSVILAMGANPRKLGFIGEKEYMGRGVAYCATCDGEFFTDKTVFVIGGGYAACEEGMFLTRYAKKVIMIVRENDFTCAKTIADKVRKYSKIEVHFNTELVKVDGENVVQCAEFINNSQGTEWVYREDDGDSFGIFVFAGYVPDSNLVKEQIELDEYGYIVTDMDKNTNVEGVAAAGDICIKNLRQVVTAVADGAIAATTMEKYVASLYNKYGFNRLKKRNDSENRKNINVSNQYNNKVSESSKKNRYSNKNNTNEEIFLDNDLKQQVAEFLELFHNKIKLKLYTKTRTNDNDRNIITNVENEIKNMLIDLQRLSNKIQVEFIKDEMSPSGRYPYIALCNNKDEYVGTGFHGIPGGHEFNSFLGAMYNLAGPGMQVSDDILEKIQVLENISIKVLVSQSCKLCPEVVKAAQYIAIMSSSVTAEIYDLSLFEDLKKKYNVMSVPCIIINETNVYFGKKSINDLLDLIIRF